VAIKTISLEIDAYERLHRAKRAPRESFSSVVRRAKWDDLPPNARALLADLRALASLDFHGLFAGSLPTAYARPSRSNRALRESGR
jgi:hypothetical protein